MSSLVQIRKQHPTTETDAARKEAELLARLAGLPSPLVAVSGGADSAYLAWTAH